MTLNWNFTSGSSSLLTQTASADATSADSQNGFQAGTLKYFTVLQDGTIQATFTNGQQSSIGQVALADFANADGLSLNGNNSFTPTSASGQAVVGTAGTGGLGSITGGSVEQSNVNVATELSDLIIAQRSYEANAKAITTFDQIEQATLQMKT
jgi:flagellar hook protein FlgE